MDFLKWKERYSNDCKLKYPSKTTQNNYISNIGLFLYNFRDSKEPKSIKTDEIKKWLLETKSPNTRNQRLCAIKSFYRLTVNMSVKLEKIPFSRKSQSLPVPLSINEVTELVKNCENKKHLAIIYLLFGCGLRVGEVLNLKPSEIHRKEKVIHIINGKGAKDRFVPLDVCVLYVLEEYWKEYRPNIWMFNGQYSTKELPTQYTNRSINQFLKDIAKKAGIQKCLHSHLGRHSYASQLVENGIDISLIQNILGHKRQSTTLIYTKITSSIINKIPSPLSQI
jgi:site-specific recombinase XerD